MLAVEALIFGRLGTESDEGSFDIQQVPHLDLDVVFALDYLTFLRLSLKALPGCGPVHPDDGPGVRH